MKNHRLIEQRVTLENDPPSKASHQKYRPLKILLALSIVVIVAGCHGGGRGYSGSPGGGYYGHRGYSPGGFNSGGVRHRQQFGVQHGFGFGGYAPGGSGLGGFGHGIGR